jgi:hypothetical protein
VSVLLFTEQSNQSNKLTTTPSNSNIELIKGQIYFLIVLGSLPPNDVDKALSFAGYNRMNASAHKK